MTIKISPQPFLIAILFLLVFLGFFVVWNIALYFIFKLLLSLALIFYGMYISHRYYFLSSPKSIRTIYWSRAGFSLQLAKANDIIPAVLLENSLFTSRLILLNFKIPNDTICSTVIFLTKKNHSDFRHFLRINNGLVN